MLLWHRLYCVKCK